MSEPARIAVSPEELQRAMLIWMRLAPKPIERRYVKWLELKAQKRPRTPSRRSGSRVRGHRSGGAGPGRMGSHVPGAREHFQRLGSG
jgi:hypothetical protein